MKVKIPAILLCVLLISGCATARPDARADLLNFLRDGQTTKAEALIKLGQPSAAFENEQIVTYRLGFDSHSKGYFIVQRSPGVGVYPEYATWLDTKYSLVLVFDRHGVLSKHSLVEVAK